MVAADTLNRLRRFLAEELWTREAGASPLGAWGIRLLQLVVMVAQGFVRDRLLLRATALAYVTGLSLIPLLAFAVALIGAIGVKEDFAAVVVRRVAAGSPEAGEWILRFVERVDLSGLGTLGASVLFATTVLTLGNIERALNDIWGVRQQRTWIRRFPDYLAVLLVAPLLLVVALSLRTTLETQWLVQKLLAMPALESVYHLGLRQAPILLLAVAFTFLYWFLPNTAVRGLSALLGGVVAAMLFDAAQSLYVGLNIGAARYQAIFGTFAALPLFLVWVYVSWTVVLLGAEVAFAHQNLARYRREVSGEGAGAAEREAVGLAVALSLGRAFHDEGAGRSPEDLTQELDVPVRTVRDVLAVLEAAGIAAPRGGAAREGTIQLGRPAERISVADVRAALRGPHPARLRGSTGSLASEVVREIEKLEAQGTGARTLAELLERIPARASQG